MFPQAPLRSRTAGFPGYGSDPGVCIYSRIFPVFPPKKAPISSLFRYTELLVFNTSPRFSRMFALDRYPDCSEYLAIRFPKSGFADYMPLVICHPLMTGLSLQIRSKRTRIMILFYDFVKKIFVILFGWSDKQFAIMSATVLQVISCRQIMT